MKKIYLLTTKTLHHLYFLKRIENNFKISKILVETKSIKPKFKIGPTYEKKRYIFEKKAFFQNKKIEWPKKKILTTININSKKIFSVLKKDRPDLGIVFGTRKISSDIINNFSDGLINIHRGRIDLYRGLDTDLWAIYHNDFKNIYLTVHDIEKELDTGKIYFEKRLKFKKKTKAHMIQYFSTVIAANGVLQYLKKYQKGIKIRGLKRPKGKYYSFMPLSLRKIVIKKFNKYFNEK